jgi:nicotinamide-nucleotide amidase
MNAIILSIGDELVLGQTVDTNSAWLSQQLAAIGCGVVAHVTVADDQSAIERAICQAAGQCDLLLISGGLGPTPDDLTRQALAAVMNEPLELNEQWLGELEKFFAARNRPMPEANRIQAMIPRTAKMIFNTAGTAAGIEAALDPKKIGSGAIFPSPHAPPASGGEKIAPDPIFSCRVFVMPGVPREMNIMFERSVLPALREKSGGAVIFSRTLHTFGLGESAIAEMLGDLMRRDRNPSVGTTVSGGIVSLRINARFGSVAEASEQLEQTVASSREALGALIFGQEDESLQVVIGRMLKAAPGSTVATAESCTGGLLGKMITDVPGSSAYYSYGWITYANQAKQELLGVQRVLLDQYGAVSEPVALAMANGARDRARSTFALAISGIAGPDGGTPDKPVGTVCIALAHPGDAHARTFLFPGDREFIRERSAKMALTMLRYHLLGQKAPF